MRAEAQAFCEAMASRRSVRDFSPDPVPRDLVEWAVRTAATAPSGANRQPWTFVAVADSATKRAIRLAAEEEEREFYERRAPAEWLAALAPLGLDWHKPFLEIAPWLVVVFEQVAGTTPDGTPLKHYYSKESVGIAAGLLIAAFHRMGLATLTHTPSPMAFLAEILGRPATERAMLLLPVGYPAVDARVPDIGRKPIEDVLVWREAAL